MVYISLSEWYINVFMFKKYFPILEIRNCFLLKSLIAYLPHLYF